MTKDDVGWFSKDLEAGAGTRRSFLKGAIAAAVASGMTGRSGAQEAGPESSPPAMVAGEFTLAAVGDVIATHPILDEIQRSSPHLLELLKADATFGNFEDTVVDLKEFKGYPAAVSGGGWLLSSTGVPADLKAMGFDLLSRANNHATDWGVLGMLETDRRLDEAGLVHAGTGGSLTAARAPSYMEGKKARVALVACTAHFTDLEPAQDGLGDIRPRPGVNALHYERSIVVPEAQFQQLAALRDMQVAGSYSKDKKADVVTLFGTKYKNGGAGQTEVGIHYKISADDEQGFLLNIRQGREVSDLAIASIHVHEPGNYSDTSPDFLPALAHRAIDAGADALIGHGPHRLRGIEIYKGKPIFYSLGDFAYMAEARDVVTPAEFAMLKLNPEEVTPEEFMEQRLKPDFSGRVWFESVVAVSRYRDGKLAEVLLHPIELGWQGPASRLGVPQVASPESAQRILARLERLSKPFGTVIAVEGNVGRIAVSAAKA